MVAQELTFCNKCITIFLLIKKHYPDYIFILTNVKP